MLTTKFLSFYNKLLATTLFYLTINEPLQEITSIVNSHLGTDRNVLVTFARAKENQDQDYYEILGVKKDATKQEIHKAFRQLAKKYHPDKNKDKGAQDEFIKVFKAYETLSDEKKRKEYDSRSKMPNFESGHWHTSTNNMPDFDINDFFRQYEDHFMRHQSQHHQAHQNAHHGHSSFHGVNLDDLFHDIDEDEFLSFSRMFDFAGHDHNHLHQHYHDVHESFGDGASFFGTHLPSQLHDTLHQFQHFQSSPDMRGHHGGYSCHTVTKQVNGILTTQTSCV